MFEVTDDGDHKIRLLLHDLQILPTRVVHYGISGPKVHDSTLAKVEGHLPLFGSLNNPVKVSLDYFAIGRRVGPSPHFGVIYKFR